MIGQKLEFTDRNNAILTIEKIEESPSGLRKVLFFTISEVDKAGVYISLSLVGQENQLWKFTKDDVSTETGNYMVEDKEFVKEDDNANLMTLSIAGNNGGKENVLFSITEDYRPGGGKVFTGNFEATNDMYKQIFKFIRDALQEALEKRW